MSSFGKLRNKINQNLEERDREINNLNNKLIFRFFKVLYIGFLFLSFISLFYFLYQEIDPGDTFVDNHKTKIICEDGKTFSPAEVGLSFSEFDFSQLSKN